jgi:hypothetical protein
MRRVVTAMSLATNPKKLLACLALVAAGYNGCGGDDGGGGVSKEDYTAEADAICQKANQRETKSGAPGPDAGVEIKPRAQRAIVAGVRDTLADLRELEAPEGDEDKVAEIVSSLERVHATREEQFAAARANDSAAETKAERAFITASQDLGAIAGSYGMAYCQSLGF